MRKIAIILICSIILALILHRIFICKNIGMDKTLLGKHLSKIAANLYKTRSAKDETADKQKEETAASAKKDVLQTSAGEPVVLYLRYGGTAEGELLSQDKDKYVLKWKGKEYVFNASQVERLERRVATSGTGLGSNQTGGWPYKNDIVVKLTNGVILDGKINYVSSDKITLVYLAEGGGQIEQDVERQKVEYLIFKPIENEESKKIEGYLRAQFPKMRFYKDGNITIVTDSYATWAKECRSTLRQAYTEIYLKFFKVLKYKKPRIQNFVVIFDDYSDFVEYAITDGVPGWAVLGYFKPDDKVLYLFNVLGDRFSKIIFEAIVGESGRAIDNIAENIKERVDDRYGLFIDGMAKEVKDKFWKAYNLIKGDCRQTTLSTLRHEFTHEVFSNWGLQNIIISKVEKNKEGLIKKKREFLETKDYKKKQRLLDSLITLKNREGPIDMKAANSWLAEGLATYCETDPIGRENERWLFVFKEMARKGPVYPLEALTLYKIGSFPGMYPTAMIDAYAQSWAFVSFLMDRNQEQFMDYMKRMSEEAAKENEDIDWLLQALGKDIRTVEKEFMEYMNTYKEPPDPFVSRFIEMQEIFRN